MTASKIMGASAAFALLFAATIAEAQTPPAPQTPPPVRVRATVDSIDGPTLNVKSREGARR